MSTPAPETVTDAVRFLEAAGYRSDFSFGEQALRSHAGGHRHESTGIVVHETFRFEGDTDPGDEAIVLGVECLECGIKGIIVSAYGPDADPQFLELVRRLQD